MNRAVKISETPKRVLMPSAAFRPEAKKWCVSKCDVEKIHFEWNIQQFLLVAAEDQRYQRSSIEFQEEPSSFKWNLAINNRQKEFGFVVTHGYDSKNRCYRIKLAILTLSVFRGYSNPLRRIFQLRIPLLRIGLE
jgi:hypothetical protein